MTLPCALLETTCAQMKSMTWQYLLVAIAAVEHTYIKKENLYESKPEENR